jgi:DNA topoisomerase VI subunit B
MEILPNAFAQLLHSSKLRKQKQSRKTEGFLFPFLFFMSQVPRMKEIVTTTSSDRLTV